MELKLYVFDINNNCFLPIKTESIPVILDKQRYGHTVIAIKNESKMILNNVIITSTGTPAYVRSATSDSVLLPTSTVAGVVHSYTTNNALKTILPNESVYLHIIVEQTGDVIIDYTNFALDVTYTSAHFTTSDLEALFEFTETKGSLTTTSSYTDISSTSGTLSDTQMMFGCGIVSFKDSSDLVTFPLNGGLSAMTLFVKVLVDEVDTEQVICSTSGFAFGLTAAREPFVRLGASTVKADVSAEDYNEVYTFGVSLTSTDDIIISVNGNVAALVDVPEEAVDLSIDGNIVIGGSDFKGNLHTLALFTTPLTYSEHVNTWNKF